MIYLFLANGFEEIEAIATIDIIRRAGLDLTTVSINSDKVAVGAHNVAIKADACICDAEISNPQMLILPGGMPGMTNLAACDGLVALLKKQVEANAPIAAICASPSVLGMNGWLEGRSATCYPGFESYLKGADCSAAGVVVDGNIITAKGPGFANEFGLAIVEFLCGKEAALEVAKGMLLSEK